MKFYMQFAALMKRRREALGLSRAELGRLTSLHRSAISKIESGRNVALAHNVLKIAIRLKIPLTELRRISK